MRKVLAVVVAGVFVGLSACCPCKSSSDTGDSAARTERLIQWLQKQANSQAASDTSDTSDDLVGEKTAGNASGDSGAFVGGELNAGMGDLSPLAKEIFSAVEAQGFKRASPFTVSKTGAVRNSVGLFGTPPVSIVVLEFDSELLAKRSEKTMSKIDKMKVFREDNAVISINCMSDNNVNCNKIFNIAKHVAD